MYIPAVPLPSISHALRAFVPSGADLPSVWQRNEEDCILPCPRGAYAFLDVARGVASNSDKPVCFFPAYFCESSLVHLRQARADIVFYRVTDSLEPDWDDVKRRAKSTHPDLFVLVHTFGRLANRLDALAFADKADCVVLEDAAHMLRPVGDMYHSRTLALFCPHKLLPLPPFSLLAVPNDLRDKICSHYSDTWRRGDWIWLAKRIVQRGIVGMGGLTTKPKPRPGGFEGGNGPISASVRQLPAISRLGRRLADVSRDDVPAVANRRRDNFFYLMRALAEVHGVEIPEAFRTWPHDTVPYALPLLTQSDYAAEMYYRLWKQGIPGQTWPDLPPEVSRQPREYPVANRWRRRLLLLPLHQSLSKKQLEAIASVLATR